MEKFFQLVSIYFFFCIKLGVYMFFFMLQCVFVGIYVIIIYSFSVLDIDNMLVNKIEKNRFQEVYRLVGREK